MDQRDAEGLFSWTLCMLPTPELAKHADLSLAAYTEFDENYGGRQGNCHVTFGSSYADTYAGHPRDLNKQRKKALGFNDSALYWDLVNTEKKRVVAHLNNGRRITIYENGQFNY